MRGALFVLATLSACVPIVWPMWVQPRLEASCDLDGDGRAERVVLDVRRDHLAWRVFDPGSAMRFEQPANTGGSELTCVQAVGDAARELSLMWRGCWGIDHICDSGLTLLKLRGGRLEVIGDVRDQSEDARYRFRRRAGRDELVIANTWYGRTQVWRWNDARSAFVEP